MTAAAGAAGLRQIIVGLTSTLKFVKLISTYGQQGVEFTFTIKELIKKLKKLKFNIDKSRGYMYNSYCRVTVTNLIL